MDGLRFSFAVPNIQLDSNPHRPFDYLAIEKPLPFTFYMH